MSNQEMTSAVQNGSSAGIQPDSCTQATLYQIYVVSCTFEIFHVFARVSSQVCIWSVHMSKHAQFVFNFVCTSVFKFIYTRVCGLVCWFSVGAGNQEGTIDPWRVGGKRGRRQEEWLKRNPSNQRAGIGIMDNKGCKKDANSLCACLFSDRIRWKGLTQGRKSCFSC